MYEIDDWMKKERDIKYEHNHAWLMPGALCATVNNTLYNNCNLCNTMMGFDGQIIISKCFHVVQ